MPVNTNRPDYNVALPKWERLRDCNGGRDAILDAGAKYVPDLPGADKPANDAYRLRGTFFNAVSRTVEGMNGMIYQDTPKVTVPPVLSEDWLKDVTLSNVSFEAFAMEAGREVFLMGRYGILVDLPEVDALDNKPYLCGYTAEQIINWRTERLGGDEVLSMIVLFEKVETAGKDEFVVEMTSQYRVLELNDEGNCVLQKWRPKKNDGKTFEKFEDEITLTRRQEPLKFIPFVFLGAAGPTTDIELPPLIDLADVNLGHWRNSVDHEHGLHLVALPTPWRAGAKGATGGAGRQEAVPIGPSKVWDLDANGRAGMLEFTGKGLEAFIVAMDEKKKQMAILGARLLEDAPRTQETASAVLMRHSGETSSLKSIAQSQEQGFTLALQVAAWWMGTQALPVEAEVTVELNKSFLNIKASAQEIQVALTALQSGEIAYETWYHILETGGWTREGVDAEQEQKDIREKPRGTEQ